MKSPRPYRSEQDLAAMRALLSAGRLADNGTYYVHPGDLNWWWYYHDSPGAFPGSCFLWERDGGTLGWVIAEGGNIDVFIRPDLRGTPEAAAMYAWGERRMVETAASDLKKLNAYWVDENDAVLVKHLEGRGFTRESRHMVHYALDLSDLPVSEPPPGYQVRGMAGAHEAASRARASMAAFQTTKPWDDYLANHLRFTRAPVYDPELDVVAVDREGEICAFAVCWLDPVTRTGLFEPVGTHPDHQRRGLGRAVLREGLRRMAARGMRQAEVGTDDDNPAARGLYESIGFVADRNLLIYSKPIGDF